MDPGGWPGHSLRNQHRPSQDPPMNRYLLNTCVRREPNFILLVNQKFDRNKCISSLPRSCSLSRKKFCSKFWLKSGRVTYFNGVPCQKLRNDEGGKSGKPGFTEQAFRSAAPVGSKNFGPNFCPLPNTFRVQCCCWTWKNPVNNSVAQNPPPFPLQNVKAKYLG